MASRRTLQSLVRSLVIAVSLCGIAHAAESTLLNVSYDVSRELYKDINPAFVAYWKARTGESLSINQSHGGSSKQAASVAEGLAADVITMNQSPDIDILVERGGFVAADWRRRLPHDAAPYTTTSVFLVRKGNPKQIRDWADLVRPGLAVIVPNPKTSGNGRYTYLAAWGYALQKSGADAAKDFVARVFANVPVLDGGGRGATTTFTQRGIGDVLVTFENEAVLIGKEVGEDKFDIVYPSVSIDAPAPVAVVEKVADPTEGQEIIAKHYFRPRDPAVLKKYASRFPAIKTFSVEGQLGGWKAVQQAHFADGGIYDQIITRK